MKQVLLQISADPTASLLTRLGDQLFTIVLLATISWMLWKRITKVQDRMDEYLSEDRQKMTDVIKNNNDLMRQNTEVMTEVLQKLKDK